MNLRPDIVRCTIFFAPYKSGAYNADTNPLASNDAVKPAADSAAWLKLGDDIRDVVLDPTGTEAVTTYKTIGGKRVPAGVIEGTKMIKIDFTTDALSRVLMEMVFGVAITINADFAPLGGAVNKEGWLKIQGYGSADQNIFVADVWTSVKLSSGLALNNEQAMGKLSALMLYSTLNAGKIPTASGL